jgi:putative drug exporter of the RND superfamily
MLDVEWSGELPAWTDQESVVDRFARFVLRRRRWVFLVWVLVFLAGGASAGKLGDRLTFDFSLPGQEGYETEVKLAQAYGTAAYASYIPVLTPTDGGTVGDHKADVAAVVDAVRQIPGLRVLDYASTGDEKFLTDDGKSTFALVYAPQPQGFVDPIAQQFTAVVRNAAAANKLDVKVTGYNQLQTGSDDNTGPSILVETLLGAVGALVVLVFVFASFLALVPLLVAAVSILATFLIVLGLTTFTDVSVVVQFLISLVGLGVAIDYSLLVVSRWREERAHGASNQDAVVTAVRTAGHAVLASGMTVAISLIALVVVPVPLIRSMGFGGMLIPVVSTAVVLPLLPALLGAVGPRVDWPRIRTRQWRPGAGPGGPAGWSGCGGWPPLPVWPRWRWRSGPSSASRSVRPVHPPWPATASRTIPWSTSRPAASAPAC